MSRILLIEDDESLGATLAENLTLESHSVDWLKEGVGGLAAAQKRLHDLVILDIMLPGKTGLEVLRSLRESSRVPVLIISAKGTSTDRIAGLELQADDYLAKPFHLKEFLLRVQSLLRRAQGAVDQIKSDELAPMMFQVGRALFDLGAMTVTPESGDVERLSDKEVRLLRLLYSRANQVVSRQEILDLVWGFNQYPSTRTVDNFIVRIRKWVEPNPQEPIYVLSHRGVGYSLKTQSGVSSFERPGDKK